MNTMFSDHATSVAIVCSGLLGLHIVERFGLYRDSPRAIAVALTAFITSSVVYQVLISVGMDLFLSAILSLPPATLCSWGLARKFTGSSRVDSNSVN